MNLPGVPDAAEARRLLDAMAARPLPAGPRPVDRPLALYGAGNLGRMALEYFTRLGIPVTLVVDRDARRRREEPHWRGIELRHPDEVPAARRAELLLAVCVVTAPFEALHAGLVHQGWSDCVPFYDITEAYRDRHPLSNGWFMGPLQPGDRERTAAVLAGWDDDRSRAHHLQFIAWHLLREEWRFDGAPVTTGDRYLIPEVEAALGERCNLLDVGAHTGGVAGRFLERFGERCRRVWALEPDRENLAALERLRAGLPPTVRERLTLHPWAVAESERRAPFLEGLGYASQLSPLGERTLELRTIDALGETLEAGPDYLKLHLEGGELAALQGATATLHRHRPLVAATSYHDRAGVWELPRWLMENLPGYRFLMRLHGWCGTGAVVYAIPGERLPQDRDRK